MLEGSNQGLSWERAQTRSRRCRQERDKGLSHEKMRTWSFFIFQILPVSVCQTVIRVLHRSPKYLMLYAVRQSIILLWCIFIKHSDLTQKSEDLNSFCTFMKQVTSGLASSSMDGKELERSSDSQGYTSLKSVTFPAMPVSLMCRNAVHTEHA